MLRSKYTTPGHKIAFSGLSNIKREPNFKLKKLKEISNELTFIPSYTLHRETKKVKYRNPFFIYERRQQVQMDLIDMSQLKKYNNNITFLLVAIDCFSKKAWVEPMENKKGITTINAIKFFLSQMDKLPKAIFFDRGKEFVNKNVYTYLGKIGINIWHPNSELKAAIVERFNRSFQDLLFKYLTQNETNKYIDKINDILITYNTRGHRTLKYMSPNEAELYSNRHHVISALSQYYSKIVSTNIKPKYHVGDIVRIQKERTKFARGYHERFTRELFEIIKLNTRMPVPTYTLKSLNKGDTISGTFYNNELQRVQGDIYKVEQVLKKRTRNGEIEYFVKWLDFDNEHNSWILASDITEVYNQNQATDNTDTDKDNGVE